MDVKETIKAQAAAAGYNFAYGTRPFINYEQTLENLKDGVVNIFLLPENERGVYAPGKIYLESIEYTVVFQVARKWETGNTTKSELDETYEQKYDRRLSDLQNIGNAFLKTFICSNNLEPLSYQANQEINVYAENIDLINYQLVFRITGNS